MQDCLGTIHEQSVNQVAVLFDSVKTATKILECNEVVTLFAERQAMLLLVTIMDQRIDTLSQNTLATNQPPLKDVTSTSLKEGALIASPAKLKTLEHQHTAYVTVNGLEYPTLMGSDISGGILTKIVCQNFFQWLIVANGGGVTLKRLRSSLKLWITQSGQEAHFKKNTISSWVKDWKEKDHIRKIEGTSGLFSMTTNELEKISGPGGVNPFLIDVQ